MGQAPSYVARANWYRVLRLRTSLFSCDENNNRLAWAQAEGHVVVPVGVVPLYYRSHLPMIGGVHHKTTRAVASQRCRDGVCKQVESAMGLRGRAVHQVLSLSLLSLSLLLLSLFFSLSFEVSFRNMLFKTTESEKKLQINNQQSTLN